MKEIELRVGNRFFYKGKVIELAYGDFAEIPYNLLTLLKPIPLTEDWLLKLGFQFVTPSEDGYDLNHAYEIPSWGKVALKNGILVPDEYYFLTGMNQEIKYVHQLENLYFGLTGEEL